MTLTTKFLAAAVAVFALLALGLGGFGWYEHTDNVKLTAANKTLAANLTAQQEAFDVYKKASAVTTARASTNQKAVTDALHANTGWGSDPVPDAVYDSLYGNRPRHSPGQPTQSLPGAGTAR